MGYAPQLEPGDAIVVLGAGGVRGDGTLSDSSLRRAIHGILLYQSGLAPLLVLSGPAGSEGPPEAEVRAALARRLGVPAEVILTEASGHTTREEAAALGAVLRSRGVRRVLLVADWEGMGRARGLFERAGLAVLPAPDEARGWSGTPEGRLKIMRLVLQEALAGLYYRVAGYL
ncbi:MAG: YdcF family protein [Candidatus Rokubacteria bacterium]|nr:YdcF family protein [Candidatus Rokubacteria bacterium]